MRIPDGWLYDRTENDKLLTSTANFPDVRGHKSIHQQRPFVHASPLAIIGRSATFSDVTLKTYCCEKRRLEN